MSTSVASLSTNFFPSAENGFSTTTSGSVSSGATTVGLASVAGYTNGEIVVFVIDPTDASKKQVFTGVMDTAGSQVTSVVWTAGTNQTHALGATVVDYATATHISMMSKGILQQHKQSGAHSDVTADSIVVTDLTVNGDFTVGTSETAGGYLPLGDVPDTVTANGNRSYDLVFNTNDLTDTVTPGMRLKLTRTVTAPTQCTDLEAGSSQYYSKTSPTGLSFTTTWTAMAWVKLESYGTFGIIARRNADTEGWSLAVNSSGQLYVTSLRIAGNNSQTTAYQSIPLNKWVHVAAAVDLAGNTATLYMDGVAVPAPAPTVTGTCAALVQGTTALVIGSDRSAGANYFDGKIAQAAVYSAVLPAATIRAAMNQTLTGSETSLVSAYTFNGASGINDLAATANNLTAQGSAVATDTDTPFTNSVTNTSITAGTTNYAIVTKASFSTNTTLTVQVPEGDTIPTSGGVSAVSYSTQKVPYGFPSNKGKWQVIALYKALSSQSIARGTFTALTGGQITAPTGDFTVHGMLNLQMDGGASGYTALEASISTSAGTTTIVPGTYSIVGSSVNTGAVGAFPLDGYVSNSSAQTYIMQGRPQSSSASASYTVYILGDRSETVIYLEPAYL